MADARRRSHRHRSLRRPQDGARISPQHSGRLLPLLSPRRRQQARLASDNLPNRLQHLAQLRDLASRQTRSQPIYISTPTERYLSTPILPAVRNIASMFPIPRTPCPIACAPSHPPILSRVDHLGSRRSALRRASPRRPHLRERASRSRCCRHRPHCRRALRLHLRHRFRLHRQADRCLSGERSNRRRQYSAEQAHRLHRFTQWI